MRRGLILFHASASLVFALVAVPPVSAQLKLSAVASDLSQPVYLTTAPGDRSRLFVVERTGAIRVIRQGMLQDQPFLDLSSRITHAGSEQGLLGLAFHPNYINNGYFYVNYTRVSDGATVISRFQASSNPDSAIASSEFIVMQVLQPYANHNGGMLAFGPDDGYLYVGLGDGGSAGDPGNRAQDSTTLLGKILRIDVDRSNGTLTPDSNPFVDRPGWRGEIWALGLRNPWRFSFDRATGDLFIADVGQGDWEEIDFQPASSPGGLNYGWRRKEGDHCYTPATNCEVGVALVDPIHEYSHDVGCSITGGYVYRGCLNPDLVGAYVFADYCSGDVWSLRYDQGVADVQSHTDELGTGSMNITSFGEDSRGELYILTYGGDVYRIITEGVPACPSSLCCTGPTGDIDLSGSVTLADLNLLVAYLTEPIKPELGCPESANANALDLTDLTDVSLLIAYLTGDVPVLPSCP